VNESLISTTKVRSLDRRLPNAVGILVSNSESRECPDVSKNQNNQPTAERRENGDKTRPQDWHKSLDSLSTRRLSSLKFLFSLDPL